MEKIKIVRYAPDVDEILKGANARTLVEAARFFGISKQALNHWMSKGLSKKNMNKFLEN